jgi:large subunit ribosomal protein L13
MNTLSYKTVSANKETVVKDWILINAENLVVGRLASEVAKILRGKTKPSYTPHADCGDNVIIINAGKIRFTGNKMTEKQYVRHTGYPGGQRFNTPREFLARVPERVIEKAIKGMLPKTKLGSEIFRNLYVYGGNEHPHEAQKPKELRITEAE